MIGYVCTCGFATDDARRAFLHRDGTPQHQVRPLEGERLMGIEREFLQTELQQIHLVNGKQANRS